MHKLFLNAFMHVVDVLFIQGYHYHLKILLNIVSMMIMEETMMLEATLLDVGNVSYKIFQLIQ